jgi:hypothetical protein
MKAYTIALATRLKRRIFNAGNIPLDVIGLIRDVLKERGLALSGYKFYDYGVVLCLECTDQEEAAKVSEVIRKATSRPIRQKYPELWKMPSLWNQSPCIVEGEMDSENMEKIEDYYRRLKTR